MRFVLLFLLTSIALMTSGWAQEEDWTTLNTVGVERLLTPPLSFQSDGSILVLNKQRKLKVDGLETTSEIWREDSSISELYWIKDNTLSPALPIYYTIQKYNDTAIEFLFTQNLDGSDTKVFAVVDYKGLVRILPQYEATFEFTKQSSSIRITLKEIPLNTKVNEALNTDLKK